MTRWHYGCIPSHLAKSLHAETSMMAFLYHGNCHCGQYRYELSLPKELSSVFICSCGVCQKKGYLWLEAPATSLRVTRDDGMLIEYRTSLIRDKVDPYFSSGTNHTSLIWSIVLRSMWHRRLRRASGGPVAWEDTNKCPRLDGDQPIST